MKKYLVNTIRGDTMYVSVEGLMEYGVQHVTFIKHVRDGEDIVHHARIITYVDIKKTRARLVSLLTNDMDMEAGDIVEVYHKRWEIELLQATQAEIPTLVFLRRKRQLHQDTDMGDTHTNLLLMVMQKRI